MNCHDIDRWLDEGGPAAAHVEAMAHARICARCQAALRAVDDLESLLAAAPAAPPAGFTAGVMARVALTPQVRAGIPVMELLPFFQTVPWWVRIALEPASLLAMLLASVLVWQGEALFGLATGGAVQLAAWIAQTLPAPGPSPAPVEAPVTTVWLQPAVLTTIALGMIPLAVMGSRLLFRWSASLGGPRHAR